ncbi:MAG: RluA family pseudouridine synthase [Acidobacteria bacterium]|nr:RluA family pseudouridine synthase [Acidobacteriota bacterium]
MSDKDDLGIEAPDGGASDELGDEPVAEPGAEPLTFLVSGEETGERLDAFLAARIEGTSRTTIKRYVEDGDVLVGGVAAKPSYKLRAGEQIEVEIPAPPPVDLTPENIPLDIIHEDEELVVVNKPAGMVTHPAAGVRAGTLANALAFHFQHLSRHAGAFRPGIVHRLDRDTSGLIVVAKNAQAHEFLSEQFRARTIFKSYVALAHGSAERDSGRIEQAIGRDPRHRTRMAVRREGGREALSLWRVRRRFERFTLLDVEIKTGRTHQIRVHLAHIKHPVVGDATYGGGRDRNLPDNTLRDRIAALGRHFLHAERLSFKHPLSGETLSFNAPLPVELQEFLDSLEI